MMIDAVKNSFIFSFQKNHNVDRPGLPMPPAPNLNLYFSLLINPYLPITFFFLPHLNFLFFVILFFFV